jgi:hypothetical protein
MAAMSIKRSHVFKILYTFVSCLFFDVVLPDSQNEPFCNIICIVAHIPTARQ